MGGGGDNHVKDTPAQKELAKISAEQWALDQEYYQPLREKFIDEQLQQNDSKEFDHITGRVATDYQQQFANARQGQAAGLAAAGIDPTSGAYQAAMDDVTTKQATSTADAASRAQNAQQDRYVSGLQGSLAMLDGQANEAMAGFGDVASQSAANARQDAAMASRNRNDNLSTAGTAAGWTYDRTMGGE